MNTNTERLQKIRARCETLLEIASKRTPGKWVAGGKWDKDYVDVGDEAFCTMHRSNATFIASCAGPAEAGWRATIAAIDGLLNGTGSFWTPETNSFAHSCLSEILTAWEGVEL